MKKIGLKVALFCVGVLAVAGAGITLMHAKPNESQAPILSHEADFPLPGRPSRWDYMSLDTSKEKLYIAHLGDSSVVALSTRTKAVLGSVAGVSEVHGVLVIPGLDQIYATATGSNEVVSIDGATLRITARIPAGVYPDGLTYAPQVHKLYVSDETGNTETVIDLGSNKRTATIALGGNVGNTQYDSVSRHIFVNIQGTNELVEIDPETDTVARRIALPGAVGNHGLLIEPTLRLAFIACEGNDKLLVLDLRTNQAIGRFNVGKGPDVLAYDVGLGLLYIATEAGTVSVFKVSNQCIISLGDQQIGMNAHTVAVNPTTHEVYFPLNDERGRPVLRVMKPAN